MPEEKNNLKQLIIVSATVSVAVFLVFTLGLSVFKERIFNWLMTETWQHNISRYLEGVDGSTFLLTTEDLIVGVVEKANPAVVSIAGFREISSSVAPSSGDPFFDIFLRQFGIEVPEISPRRGAERQVSGGSGFFISSDGYILTNRHVIEFSEASYRVITNEGVEYEAEIVAQDDILDVAVLKIEIEDAPVLGFGSSRDLKLGQTIVVIGNALGEFQNTVSVGVVSGLSRSIVAGSGFGRSEFLDGVIQTDAAINQGNSGGPVLNLSGEVVGMSVAMAIGSENIGFALPSESLSQISESVITEGRIIRPYIGVRYLQITPEMARSQNLPSEAGVLLVGGGGDTAIEPDSPAVDAGLKAGDIITHFNNERLVPGNSLSTVIRRYAPGDEVVLRVIRGEETFEVTLILGGI